MAKQLCADPVLAERLTRPWKRVVVLERQARGGGSHHWYYTDIPQGFEEVLARVGGGSLISFYFGDTMTVESLSEDSVGRVFAAQQIDGEIVLGTPEPNDVEFDDRGLPTGPDELSEALTHIRQGTLVVWGPWPPPEDEDAITIRLVDADGEFRQHPT